MKKTTTLSIDEQLLIRAKKEIPNLSRFVSECLEVYLGDNGAGEIQDQLNKIKECNLQIFLLSKQNKDNEFQKILSKSQINKVWLRIWSKYRAGTNVSNDEIIDTAQLLSVDVNHLNNLLKTLTVYCNRLELVDCDDWDYAEKKYKSIVNGAEK